MGIVNLAAPGSSLGEITQNRPLATVPFGGRYRLIDFILSGMANSGITGIGILAPWQHRSLLDHLSTYEGKEAIMFLPSAFGFAGSDTDHLSRNADFLLKSRQDHIIMASAHVVSNFNFQKLWQFHRQVQADVTMLYKREDVGEQECANCVLIDLKPDQRITGFRFRPAVAGEDNFFLGAFLLKKELLLKLLAERPRGSRGPCSILQGVMDKARGLRAYAFHYDGYAARIHCLRSYYRHNMALLDPAVWQELFVQPQSIYTKIKDDVPAKYLGRPQVANALIAGGCRIAGTIESSILFRNVTVGNGGRIKNSILMPNTTVSEAACLEYVICDKDVVIGPGRCVRGRRDDPVILRKGTVV